MLRPKIAAKFTEYTTMATTINASKKYLSDAIKNDSTIFPPKHIMKKSFLNVPPVTREELVLDHKTNRQWTLIKQGEFKSW